MKETEDFSRDAFVSIWQEAMKGSQSHLIMLYNKTRRLWEYNYGNFKDPTGMMEKSDWESEASQAFFSNWRKWTPDGPANFNTYIVDVVFKRLLVVLRGLKASKRSPDSAEATVNNLFGVSKSAMVAQEGTRGDFYEPFVKFPLHPDLEQIGNDGGDLLSQFVQYVEDYYGEDYKAILKEKLDGVETYGEIASRVNTSPITVSRKMRRIREAAVIFGNNTKRKVYGYNPL